MLKTHIIKYFQIIIKIKTSFGKYARQIESEQFFDHTEKMSQMELVGFGSIRLN